MRWRSSLGALLALALSAPAPAAAHGLAHGDPAPVMSPAAELAMRSTRSLPSLPGIARSWCGVSTATDLAPAATARPDLKLVYARPAGVGDHLGAYASTMQADAAWASAVIGGASLDTRTLSWDLGTPCGPQYADIVSVRLPRRAGYYETGHLSTRLFRLRSAVLDAMGQSPLPRDYVVYTDGIDGIDLGAAELEDDDRAGPGNLNDIGNRTAVLWSRDGRSPVGMPTDVRRATLLHEIGHLLGAVQLSAPHSTGAGHCTDGWDVMCYADGGPHDRLTFPCRPASIPIFDCGGDDYFNPDPLPGSYLSTHRNAYDSAFLCPVEACVPAVAAPRAAFRSVVRPRRSTMRVTLDASRSAGAGGIVHYAWDLNGDGVFETDGGASPVISRRWRGRSRAVVRLLVRDGAGSLAQSVRTLRLAR